MTDMKVLEDEILKTADAFDEWTKHQGAKYEKLADKVAELEQSGAASRVPVPSSKANPAEVKAWDNFLRTGDATEIKSWTAGAVDGSNAVPEHIYGGIQEQLLQYSPIRRYANVVRADSGDFKYLVADDAQVASWAAEGTTRSVGATAYLNSVAPTGGEMYSVIQVSNWFLQDAMFDVSAFIQQQAAKQFGSAEGEAFATGNGTNKPTGLTNGATSSSADQGASPERAFGTYQHIATGVAGSLPGDMLSSPQGDVMGVFYDVVAALRASYLPNAAWYMNPTTLATLLKKRDLDGRSIVVHSGYADGVNRLLGYPIRIVEHLPNIGSNTLPIWFGDMNAGYIVADRVGMEVIVDRVTTRGHTIFYVARRVYGGPADTAALKAVKCATS